MNNSERVIKLDILKCSNNQKQSIKYGYGFRSNESQLLNNGKKDVILNCPFRLDTTSLDDPDICGQSQSQSQNLYTNVIDSLQ